MFSISPILAAFTCKNKNKDKALHAVISYMANKQEQEKEAEHYPIEDVKIKTAELVLNGTKWSIPYIQRMKDQDIITNISAALNATKFLK